jgi:hypothetical protein
VQREIAKQPQEANDALLAPDQRRDVLAEPLESVAADHPEVVRKRSSQTAIHSTAAAHPRIHDRASCLRLA